MIGLGAALGSREVEGRGLRGDELAKPIDGRGEFARTEAGDVFFELSMTDAWVWDMYRPARFVSSVRVVTFKDVNVEELPEKEL